MPLKDDLKKLMQLTEKKSKKQLASYEKEIILQYKAALKSMRAELSKFYESNYSTQRLLGVIDKIEKIIQDAGKNGLKTTQKGVKNSVEFNFNAVQENLRSVIGTELSFAVLPTEIINSLVVNNKFAKINWQKHGLKNIQQDSQFIKNKVYQSVIRGENYDVVSKQIANQINITASNALRIVKTEVHRASNEARILSMETSKDAAEKLGFKSVKIWEGGESFPRSHDSMNGTAIPIDQDFNLPSGASAAAPGLTGNAGDDINCGCYLEFDIEEIQ